MAATFARGGRNLQRIHDERAARRTAELSPASATRAQRWRGPFGEGDVPALRPLVPDRITDRLGQQTG